MGMGVDGGWAALRQTSGATAAPKTQAWEPLMHGLACAVTEVSMTASAEVLLKYCRLRPLHQSTIPLTAREPESSSRHPSPSPRHPIILVSSLRRLGSRRRGISMHLAPRRAWPALFVQPAANIAANGTWQGGSY